MWQLLASAPPMFKCTEDEQEEQWNNFIGYQRGTQIDDVDGGKRRDQGFHTTEGALREGQKTKDDDNQIVVVACRFHRHKVATHRSNTNCAHRARFPSLWPELNEQMT